MTVIKSAKFTVCAVLAVSAAVCMLSLSSRAQTLSSALAKDAGTSGGKDAVLPYEDNSYEKAQLERFRKMGAQFLFSSSKGDVYKLAAAINNFRDYRNLLIFRKNFAKIEDAPADLLIEIAVSRAPHIDLFSDAFRLAQNHPVHKFYDEKTASGSAIGLISYGKDVREAAKRLFGEELQLSDADGISVKYDKALDLYYLPRLGAAIATDYPVVLSANKSESGILTVRTALLSFWECYGQWSAPDGSWKSVPNAKIADVKAYVLAHLDRLPQYQFTFACAENGELSLTGFQSVS